MSDAQEIAEEIHDEPLQYLAAARLRLELLEARIDDPIRARVTEVLDLVRRADLSLRGILLASGASEDVGAALGTVLEQWADLLLRGSGIRWSVDQGPLPLLPAPLAATVTRVGQEAIANVAKHSLASVVEVTLVWKDGELRLDVVDDGRGFAPAEGLPGHLGLHLMSERAARAGGALDVESSAGAGCRVSLRVPVPPSVSSASTVA